MGLTSMEWFRILGESALKSTLKSHATLKALPEPRDIAESWLGLGLAGIWLGMEKYRFAYTKHYFFPR